MDLLATSLLGYCQTLHTTQDHHKAKTEKSSCNQRNRTADQGETLCLSPLQEKPISRAAPSVCDSSQQGDRTNSKGRARLRKVLSTVKLNFPPLNQHHVTSGISFAISLENPKGNLRHCSLTLSHSRHSLHLRVRQISSTGFLLNTLTWMSLRTANQMLHRSLSTLLFHLFGNNTNCCVQGAFHAEDTQSRWPR